jgi:hypothetical protein
MPKCTNFIDSPVLHASDKFSRNSHFNASPCMNYPDRSSPIFYMNSQSFNNRFESHSPEPSFNHTRTRSLSPPRKVSYTPPVRLRIESNVPGCSKDVGSYNRIVVPDVSNVVTESLSATITVPVSLNPVCTADDDCPASVTEPCVKQFSETGSQTDVQENAPLINDFLCTDENVSDVNSLFKSEVSNESPCDLISPSSFTKHHSDISELCINGGGAVVNQAMSNRIGDSLWVMVDINGSGHIFLLDSGSQITFLRHSFGNTLTPTTLQVKTATGQNINVQGMGEFMLGIGEFKAKHKMYVSEDIFAHTLGTDFLIKARCTIDLRHMKLRSEFFETDIMTQDEMHALASLSVKCEDALKPVLPDVVVAQFARCPEMHREAIFQQFLRYEHLFNNLGTAKGIQFEINLSDPRPVKQPVRRVTAAQREIITEQVNEMLRLGVIRKSNSPWSTPCVLVKKKNGETRLCLDYRSLNQRTIKDSFPLPRSDDLLTNLQGAKYFSTLDLKSGYWQVLVKPEDIAKTAFVVPDGLFECIKLPFGLANAPSCFQRMMNEVLRPVLHRGCEVYLDDIVVHGRTWEEMLDRLMEVFDLLTKAGLTLNAKKCKFFATDIEILGHRITPEGCSVLDDKIDVIRNWPEPMTRKQVRSFLGLAGYYRAHVKDFAKIAAPLHKLTSIKSQWRWTQQEQDAFDHLKVALQNTPVLQLFDPDKEVFLDCDASMTAVGAVLNQKDENGLDHPVGYFSKCLSRAESNMCVTRLELFSVITSLKHWRYLLLGRKITVRSDHGSLMWLRNFKHPESQLARWLEFLSEYDLNIVYRAGNLNQNADSLSRRACPPACSYCSRRELLSEERAGLRGIIIGSTVDWPAEQEMDPELKEVRSWLQLGQKPAREEVSLRSPSLKSIWREFDQYSLRDGILVRKFFTPSSEYLQIVIPRHQVSDIITTAHQGGHWGIERTKLTIRDKYYWPGWIQDIIAYIKQCEPCNRKKGPPKRQVPTFKKALAGAPMERINIDFLGPLPLTPRQNRHLLVVTDSFTKWLYVIPLPSQEAHVVADALIEHVFSHQGIPSQLHSDQGANFESALIQRLCDRLGIHKTRTTAYHPQGNGQTEKANRTILSALAKTLVRDIDWDLEAPIVAFYYNSSVHKATGHTPALLALGREMAIPVSVLFPPVKPSIYADTDDYANQLEKRLAVAHEFARKHLEFDWSVREKASENLRAMRPLDPSKNVYIFNPRVIKGRCPKFATLWAGPYRIIEQVSERLYRIKVGGRAPIRVVNRANIYQP